MKATFKMNVNDTIELISSFLNTKDIYRHTLLINKQWYAIGKDMLMPISISKYIHTFHQYSPLTFESYIYQKNLDINENDSQLLRYTCDGYKYELYLLLQHPRIVIPKDILKELYYNHNCDIVLETLLQDKRIDPCIYGAKTLIAMLKYPQSVNLLLKDGRCNPAWNKSAALRVACAHGYSSTVELLLQDNRSDPTVGKYRCVWITCIRYRDSKKNKERYIDILRMLLNDPRIDINNVIDRKRGLLSIDKDTTSLMLHWPKLDLKRNIRLFLHVACRFSIGSIVDILLNKYAIDPIPYLNDILLELTDTNIIKLLLVNEEVVDLLSSKGYMINPLYTLRKHDFSGGLDRIISHIHYVYHGQWKNALITKRKYHP